jgi:methyl-accepting chemotaxis protein
MKRLLNRISNSKLANWAARSIRNKLLLAMMVAGVLPLVVVGVAINLASAQSLRAQSFEQLKSVQAAKSQRLADYFSTIQGQIAAFAEDRMVIEAMKDFQGAFPTVATEDEITPVDIERMRTELKTYYSGDFAQEYEKRHNGQKLDILPNLAQLDAHSIVLQHSFIHSNKFPLGQKDKLVRPSTKDDKSQYSTHHETYHPVISSFRQRFGYYDIFLVDAQSGDIVYTVFKELDYSTSLKDGPYSKTNIGRCYQMGRAAPAGTAVMVDYEEYVPSYDDPAGFVAAPIYEGSKLLGVAMFQIPIDRVNQAMASTEGLGETGETYVVGMSKVGDTELPLFRNQSRFVATLHNDLKLSTPLTSTIINPQVVVDTEATRSARAGQTGTRIINDYRGVPVLSSWTPLTIYPGRDGQDAITWSLLAEIDLAEINIPVRWMNYFTIAAVLLGILLVAFVATRFANTARRQTGSVVNMLQRINQGDYTTRAEVASKDELGQMAEELNRVMDKTLKLVQSENERDQMQNSIMKLMEEVSNVAEGDLTVEAEVTADMTGAIADSFNYMIAQLRSLVQNVQQATAKVANSAEEIQATTEDLSEGSEQQSARLVSTSTALTQMVSSIQQVASHTAESATVAHQAKANAQNGRVAVERTIEGMSRIRDQVQESAKRFKRLGESSQSVGEIVQLIADIADRTSILALNASIQAAMAGDAGKGFAVVAEEVERLAERSNKATNEIATLIKTIQGETAEAISAMEQSTQEVVSGSKLAKEAGDALSEIEGVSNRLADLIQEMSVSSTQQVQGAETLSHSMEEISRITNNTATGSKQAALSVRTLATMATELRSSVSMFKISDSKA